MQNGVRSDVYEEQIQEKNHGRERKEKKKRKNKRERRKKKDSLDPSGSGLFNFEGDFLKF